MTEDSNPLRIERARALFLEAAEHPAAHRESFVRSATGDPLLQDVVLGLLAAADGTDSVGAAGEDDFQLPEMAIDEAGEVLRLLWALPEVIGPWRLVRPLAASGRSLVYMAERLDDGQVCALKLLPPRGMQQPPPSWKREVEMLQALDHPVIAQLMDAQLLEIDDRLVPTVATELIDGIDARRWVQDYAPPRAAVLELMLQVVQAVAWLHEKGVVHGDLKPDNVLVATPEVGPKPVIVDFDSSLWTAEGRRPRGGTLAYLSPERLNGGPADERGDQFALGVMLYELLAGGHPYASVNDSRTVIERRFWRGLEPLHMQLPDASVGLDQVLQVAMAVDPRHRYATVTGMGQDLQRAMRGRPPRHVVPPLRIRVRSALRRNRRLMRTMSAVVIVAMIGAAVAGAFAVNANRARMATELVRRTDLLDLATQAMAGGRLHLAQDYLSKVPDSQRDWTWGVLHRAAVSPGQLIPMAADDTLAIDTHGLHIMSAAGDRREVEFRDGWLRRVLEVYARNLVTGLYAPPNVVILDPPDDLFGPWIVEHPAGWTVELDVQSPHGEWREGWMHTRADGNVLIDLVARRASPFWEYALHRRLVDGETGALKKSLHWVMDSGPMARHKTGALIVVGRAGELAEIDKVLNIRQRGNLPFSDQLNDMWISPDYQHMLVRTSEESVVLDRYLLSPHVWAPLDEMPGEPLDVINHVLLMRTAEGIVLHRIEPEALNEVDMGNSYCTSLDRRGDNVLVSRFFGENIHVLDVVTGDVELSIPVDGVRAACFLNDGGMALAASWSTELHLHDASGVRVDTLELEHLGHPISKLLQLADGRLLVLGTSSSALVTLGSRHQETVTRDAVIDADRWSDGSTLALWAGSDGRGARVERVEDGMTLVHDAGQVTKMATIPGRLIALVGRDAVTILNADGTVRQVLPGVDVRVHDANFMGEHRLLVARQDGFIDVFDLHEGLRVGSIPAHEGYVKVLLPIDEDTLLSAGADGAVRIWGPREILRR